MRKNKPPKAMEEKELSPWQKQMLKRQRREYRIILTFFLAIFLILFCVLLFILDLYF